MSDPRSHPCLDLPYLTGDIPGIGGRIKASPEDFVVEEIPLYEPSGEGTHTYMLIEKRGLGTLEAVAMIANALGRSPRDIGYAGLKDAHALTRQYISVEHLDPAQAGELCFPGLRVVAVARHRNKIKLGHLRGNRFTIRIRGYEPDGLTRAARILEMLATRGVPNFFGPQRFGGRGDNWRIGLAMLREDLDEAMRVLLGGPLPIDGEDVRRARALYDQGRVAEAADAWPHAFPQQRRLCRIIASHRDGVRRAWASLDRALKRLYVAAVQAYLFNAILAQRIDRIDHLEAGDLAYKHDNGACFLVEDPEAEQPRCRRLEISPTGPMFGYRMTPVRGEPGGREQRLLERFHLTLECFRRLRGMKVTGSRRPLRVPLTTPRLRSGSDGQGPFLQLEFALPAGSYATSVTREICKNPGGEGLTRLPADDDDQHGSHPGIKPARQSGR